MKNRSKVFDVLAVILIMIFCFSITPITLQNDTYYTIAIGKHITEKGIDMKDPFSWHENLPYTYPHWLYDLGTYLVFNMGENLNIDGFNAIYVSTVILSMLLGAIIYLVNSKICKNKIVSFLITIGAIYLLKSYIAARAQLVTFILFLLTVFFIEKYLETRYKRYLIGLIIIPILIANLHIAVWPFYFILYLPYIAEYLVAVCVKLCATVNLMYYNRRLKKKIIKNKSVEKIRIKINKRKKMWGRLLFKQRKRRQDPYKVIVKKNDAVKILIIIFILTIFTGFLTPIGNTPFTYLIKTKQGNTMESISEHLPLTLINNVQFMTFLVLFLLLLIFTDTKIRLKDLFMIAGLLLLAFMSRRQVSMFVLIGSIIFANLVSKFVDKYAKDFSEKVLKAVCTIPGKIILTLLILIISIIMYKPKINDKIVNEKSYPVKAANYILSTLDVDKMKLFNEYNYGSYLLYRGIPVFIDSRADLYAPEFNKVEKQEGRDIFSDFMGVSNLSKYYEDVFERYGITHVILKSNTKLNKFISKDNKYSLIYEDKDFVIYEKVSMGTEKLTT